MKLKYITLAGAALLCGLMNDSAECMQTPEDTSLGATQSRDATSVRTPSSRTEATTSTSNSQQALMKSFMNKLAQIKSGTLFKDTAIRLEGALSSMAECSPQIRRALANCIALLKTPVLDSTNKIEKTKAGAPTIENTYEDILEKVIKKLGNIQKSIELRSHNAQKILEEEFIKLKKHQNLVQDLNLRIEMHTQESGVTC